MCLRVSGGGIQMSQNQSQARIDNPNQIGFVVAVVILPSLFGFGELTSR